MATITITIDYPDGKAADLRDTIAAAEGYQYEIDDGQGGMTANPESKAEFVLRRIKEETRGWIKNRYTSFKRDSAIVPTGEDLGLS